MTFFADRVIEMARSLTRFDVDLGDERAVIDHLRSHSFSEGEISAGMDAAIDTARIERVHEDILNGIASGDWSKVA